MNIQEAFVKTFGVSVTMFVIIQIFYAVIAYRIFGPTVSNGLGIIISVICTLGTILLIGHYGLMIVILPLIIALSIFCVVVFRRGFIPAVRIFTGIFGGNRMPAAVRGFRATFSPASQPQQQPGRLYHGTDLKSALDIFTTGLWLVGKAVPHGVWMTDQFKVASHYSGKNGGIVIVKVSPDIRLSNHSSNVYILKVPDAVPNQEYHRIEGLIPVGILDAKGDKIM